jgi:hypothetical protein
MSRQAGILNLARRRPDHYVRAKLILQLKRAAISRPVASKRSTTLFALGLGLSHQAEERRISRLPFRCRHQFLARLGIGFAVRPQPIALGAPIFESRHQGHLLRPLAPFEEARQSCSARTCFSLTSRAPIPCEPVYSARVVHRGLTRLI